MNKKLLFSLLMSIAFVLPMIAQEAEDVTFIEHFDRFSKKKPAYLTLTDGTEITGNIDDIDRKKGLIEEITIEDESGKETKYTPEQISHMYIAPSGWNKLANSVDKVYNVNKWDQDNGINKEYIKEGYVYFEQCKVQLKRKKMVLLMQLLNPAFSSKIKVYHDALAGETMRVGVAGLTVAGGNEKSYYIRKGSKTAERLKKKHYDDEFKNLYGDCKEFIKANKKKIKWKNFAQNIFDYSNACN